MSLNTDPWNQVLPIPRRIFAPRAFVDCDMSGHPLWGPEATEWMPPDDDDSWVMTMMPTDGGLWTPVVPLDASGWTEVT